MNFLRFLFLLLPIATVLQLTACGNDDDQDTAGSERGDVVIGLTDAPGDFVRYSVDVVSLTLTKANGAVVETLPLSTRVDFAQYTEMTEFLTAATIPSGVYTHAVLTLDYSDADLQVEDADGKATPVSRIQDEQGNVLGRMQLTVRLENRNALTIVPGVPVHLTLDFDLGATNRVNLTGAAPVVTVQPMLLAEINPQAPKVHRLRGALKSVDTDQASFRVVIRPFIHVLSGGDERFGTLNVVTDDQTLFEIDDGSYQGAAGIAQLATLTDLSAVVVVGDLLFNPARFEAREVYAGSRVPGGTLDVVSGNVIGRSGDVLTLKGATLIRAGGSVVFNDRVQVTIGAGTLVRRQLSSAAFTGNDISIGQRVAVFGTLVNDQVDSLALDAGQGYVGLLFTTLRATVVATAPLTLDLQAIDGRRIALFDFAGSGADPTHYRIATGNLDVSNIGVATTVKVRGFANIFNNASGEDFTAQTVVDVSNVDAALAVGWLPASAGAFAAISDSALVLNLAGTGLFHHVSRAGVSIDLTRLAATTSLAPADANGGLYFIRQGDTWQLHTHFAGLVQDLQTRLNNGLAVRFLTAHGPFDDGSATMRIKSATITVR